MEKIRASILLPVYNGAQFIAHQLDSILPMLAENDEIVISYDESTDNTLEIIREYEQKDPRIKVFINEGEHGVWPNSMNSLRHIQGEYIFPCDQDDEWLDDKINYVIEEMEKQNAASAVHDGYVCDKDLQIEEKTIFERCQTSNSILKNFAKNTIAGCCLAYRSYIKDVFLQSPNCPDASDQWAAIAMMMTGKMILLDRCLIKHRIHGGNYTTFQHRALKVVLAGRLALLKNMIWLQKNKKRFLKNV